MPLRWQLPRLESALRPCTARCLAAAVVKNAPEAEGALTPPVLALDGQEPDKARRRSSPHLRAGRPAGLGAGRFQPMLTAPGRTQMSWTYSARPCYGPSGSRHEWIPATSMIHTRYSIDSGRPWLGVPPWSWAGATGAAIAALERLVAREAAAPHGRLLGVPESPQTGEDDDTRQLDKFRSDLAKAKGRTLVVEHSADWNEETPGSSSRSKLESVTFGMERGTIDALRTATGRDILSSPAACRQPCWSRIQ